MFIKLTKSGLATAITILFTFSLLLSFAVTRTNAEGPLGTPPQGNVSPTFSDVTVQGQVTSNKLKVKGGTEISNSVYDGKPLFKVEPGQLGTVTLGNGAKDNSVVYFKNKLQFDNSDVSERTILNVAQIKNILSDQSLKIISDALQIVLDTVANKIVFSGAVEIGSSKIASDFKVYGKSFLVDDLTIGLQDDGKKDFNDVVSQDLLKLRAKNAFNLFHPKIESTGPLDIRSDEELLIDAGTYGTLPLPSGGNNLKLRAGTLDISALYLNVNTVSTKFNNAVKFSSSTAFAAPIISNLSVDGHVKATSIGELQVHNETTTIKPGQTKTLSVLCQSGEMPIRALYTYSGSVFMTPIIWGNMAQATKKNYFNTNRDLSVSIFCWNPNL